MNKTKPINPYSRLLGQVRDYMSDVKYRHKRIMFVFEKPSADKQWSLNELHQRVIAAEQLGYDVIIEAKDGNLVTSYVKKIPQEPYEWA